MQPLYKKYFVLSRKNFKFLRECIFCLIFTAKFYRLNPSDNHNKGNKMKNIGELMLKAQKVQSQMTILQSKMEELTFEGQAANGLVKMTLTGKGYGIKVQIDDTLLKDKESLEDLIVVAISDAREKADAYMVGEMDKMQKNLGLPPGFKMPF